MINFGEKYLVTTLDWFYAPDGQVYKAVFGTAKKILSSESALGVKTNAKSTNWYAQIGNMLIAGCQIHYVVKTDNVNLSPNTSAELDHQGQRILTQNHISRIYNADEDYKGDK